MEVIKIKIGQVWESRKNGVRLLISGKHGSRWKTKQLTEKQGVYKNTHTMMEVVLFKEFKLL